MNKNQYNLETLLYTRTDAELIHLAGEILGTHKLRLNLSEAVECIRRHWEAA